MTLKECIFLTRCKCPDTEKKSWLFQKWLFSAILLGVPYEIWVLLFDFVQRQRMSTIFLFLCLQWADLTDVSLVCHSGSSDRLSSRLYQSCQPPRAAFSHFPKCTYIQRHATIIKEQWSTLCGSLVIFTYTTNFLEYDRLHPQFLLEYTFLMRQKHHKKTCQQEDQMTMSAINIPVLCYLLNMKHKNECVVPMLYVTVYCV